MRTIQLSAIVFLILLSHFLYGQKVDVGIFPSSTPNQMEIRIRPTYAEGGTRSLTNAQFTIRWLKSSGINSITPGTPDPYSFYAQGSPLENGGYYYQLFATSGGYTVSWTANSVKVIRTFTFSGTTCPQFEIADDAFVKQLSVNGAYYFEINGADKTGILYQPSAQQPAPGAAGSITGSTSVCAPQASVSYTITPVTNASSYVWTYTGAGATITGNGPSCTIDFSASATSGNLSVHGVNGCGNGPESPAFPITVTLAAVGGTATASPATVCSGGSTVLTLSGYAGTIQWQQSEDGASGWTLVSGGSGGSGASYTTPVLTTTTWYRAAVTGGSCGTAYSNVQKVTVNLAPDAPLSGGNKAICMNQSTPALTVTTASGITADWYVASAGGTAVATGTLSYTPASAGTWYAEARNSSTSCISASRTAVTLIINPLPNVYAGADKSVPSGTATTIADATATGKATLLYAWTPAASFVNSTLLNPATVNLTAANTFTLTVTDGNGCQNSDQIFITVTGSALAVNPAAATSGLCTGSSTELNANASGGSGNYTYSWSSNPAGFTSSLAKPSVTPAATTTYTVQVNDGFNTVSGQATITVNALPAAPVSGGNKAVCSGQTLPALTVTTGAAITADWYAAPAAGTALASGNLSYTPTNAGTYYAEARNTTTGCVSASRTAVTLTVNSNPAAPASGGNKSVCVKLPLPALTVLVGTEEKADWYMLSSGGTPVASGNLSFTPSAAGTWYAEARNTTSGCTSTTRTPVSLTVNSLPTVFAGADQSISAGTSTTIADATASGVAPLTYLWAPAESFVNATLLNPVTVNLNTTNNYVLTVTDGNGCTNSDQVAIKTTVPSVVIIQEKGYQKKIWPNPTKGLVTIDLIGDTVRELELKIFNMQGSEIFCRAYTSCNTISFNLSQNPSGMYLVQIKMEGYLYRDKLILE